MRSNNEKAVGSYQTAFTKQNQSNYTKYQQKYTNYFDRSLLPTPAEYYSQEFPNMRIKSEWVKVCCPFHDDHNPSLGINMVSGHFRCHACGAKGHDVLAFQMQRYQQTFKQAAIALGAWRCK